MRIDLLLPPASTALERAIDAAGALRLASIDAPVASLWNPRTIAAPLLPWLAWGLSIDRWSPDWTEVQKRDATAQALDDQRRKGTPATVQAILASYEPLLQLVEWFAMQPKGAPHTFEVRLPRGDARTPAQRTAMINDVLRDIALVKPVRSHFRFVQLLEAANIVEAVALANVTLFARFDATATTDTSRPWDALLQSQDGEPLEFGAGELMEA